MDKVYSDSLPRFLEKDLENFRCCHLSDSGERCEKQATMEVTAFLESNPLGPSKWLTTYLCDEHVDKRDVREANGEFGN